MRIPEKVELAKRHIRFISEHDDVPMADIREALMSLKGYIDHELQRAVARRTLDTFKQAGERLAHRLGL